ATAAQVDRAFDVTEMQWQLTATKQTYYANNVAPTVPAAVDAVQGLSNIGQVMAATASAPTQASSSDPGSACQSDPESSTGQICLGALEGSDLRMIYNVGSTYTGQGQALAVWGDGDPQGPTADLHQYESDRGLPLVNTVFVNTDSDDCVASGVQPSGCDTSGEEEWALDSEASTAMAPGGQTLYYFFPSAIGGASGVQAWADYDSTANGPVPMQMNASFGGCESLAAAEGETSTFTSALADAAGKGKTLFVAAGDLGAGCTFTGVNGFTPGGPPQAMFPCTDSWVVCVGGTALYSNGATGSQEQRADLGGTCTPQTTVGQLNHCAELAWAYGGGGSSYVFPAPQWQQALSPFPIAGHCLVQPDLDPYSGAPPVCRGVPDVAALSGAGANNPPIPNGAAGVECTANLFTSSEAGVSVGDQPWSECPFNGFNGVFGGGPQTSSGGPTPGREADIGGTSLASPLWEGMWADIQSTYLAQCGADCPAPAGGGAGTGTSSSGVEPGVSQPARSVTVTAGSGTPAAYSATLGFPSSESPVYPVPACGGDSSGCDQTAVTLNNDGNLASPPNVFGLAVTVTYTPQEEPPAGEDGQSCLAVIIENSAGSPLASSDCATSGSTIVAGNLSPGTYTVEIDNDCSGDACDETASQSFSASVQGTATIQAAGPVVPTAGFAAPL
ncbi:MAG TPA: hypothetical protein VEJ21_05430, partial [Acidimicrobiales bacterium]|nr:hypothetical protein [Acidimicrobiales bacterium]